jgi:hypothetical protein
MIRCIPSCPRGRTRREPGTARGPVVVSRHALVSSVPEHLIRALTRCADEICSQFGNVKCL